MDGKKKIGTKYWTVTTTHKRKLRASTNAAEIRSGGGRARVLKRDSGNWGVYIPPNQSIDVGKHPTRKAKHTKKVPRHLKIKF